MFILYDLYFIILFHIKFVYCSAKQFVYLLKT